MDQTKGEKSGPHINHEEIKEENLICQINNTSILADKNGDNAMSSC